jgi:hypothetical protein
MLHPWRNRLWRGRKIKVIMMKIYTDNKNINTYIVQSGHFPVTSAISTFFSGFHFTSPQHNTRHSYK